MKIETNQLRAFVMITNTRYPKDAEFDAGTFPDTFSDAYLNHYADAYVAQRIHAYGVSLESYLYAPADYDLLALDPEPLLPAQQPIRHRRYLGA